jgi:hypothetical protein
MSWHSAVVARFGSTSGATKGGSSRSCEIVELEEELRAANDRLAQHGLAYDPGELRDTAVPFEDGPRLLRHRNAVAGVLEYGQDRQARTKDRQVRKNERARQ